MIKEVPRGVLPIWKFASKDVIRYALTGIHVSVPETKVVRIQATDGKAMCRVDLHRDDVKAPVASDSGAVISVEMWKKIGKAPRGAIGPVTTFDIMGRAGSLDQKAKVTLKWLEKSMILTTEDWEIEGKFPDTDIVMKGVGDDPVKSEVYNPELLGESIVVVKEIVKGMGAVHPAIKITGLKENGMAIRAKGDSWKLTVVIMGLVKSAY